MKTNLFYLVLFIITFPCCTNNKALSDSQKEKIKSEVKEVVTAMFQGIKEANYDMATKPFLLSPDFFYISNGNLLTEKSLDNAKQFFSSLRNQEITTIDETYTVIDNSTVMYTTKVKCLMNFKDGHALNQEPWYMQYLFKKLDNQWRVINGTESGDEQYVKGCNAPMDINQVELSKQILGNWKIEIGKDTILYWSAKTFGNNFESYFKTLINGKLVSEGKQLFGYDNKLDKYIGISTEKEGNFVIAAFWFTSKDKFTMTYPTNLTYPTKSSFRAEGQIKSPDYITQVETMNGKVVARFNYLRVK